VPPGRQTVLSVNPVVGETNDGYLNDIRGRHITADDVFAALKSARGGPVEEGAGRGGYGNGGLRLERRHRHGLAPSAREPRRLHGRGFGADQLRRRAHHRRRAGGDRARAWLGLARTGGTATNGSGEYAIAFSTAAQVRIHAGEPAPTRKTEVVTTNAMTPLFLAAIEATEEAVYNSLFKATTTSGNGHTVEALPIGKTVEIPPGDPLMCRRRVHPDRRAVDGLPIGRCRGSTRPPLQERRLIMPTGTLRLHRVLRAPPERVYRAFLDPDANAKWLPPHGFTCRVHHLDAKAGGTYRMSFTNFATGRGHSFGGRYLELVPNERIRHTDAFEDASLKGEMQTTISLRKVPMGTELHIVQEGIPEAIPTEQCYLGWQESLTQLAKLVEPEIAD
jgi:uncharacterized protein YndB with AHSA1/START domain